MPIRVYIKYIFLEKCLFQYILNIYLVVYIKYILKKRSEYRKGSLWQILGRALG